MIMRNEERRVGVFRILFPGSVHATKSGRDFETWNEKWMKLIRGSSHTGQAKKNELSSAYVAFQQRLCPVQVAVIMMPDSGIQSRVAMLYRRTPCPSGPWRKSTHMDPDKAR